MGKFLIIAGLAAVLAAAGGVMLWQDRSPCDRGETVIRFSHVTNTDKHPKGIAAALLAERVNDEMDGLACMEVYPDSALYDDTAVFDALLSGDVQLAAPSLSKFERFTKKFGLFDLPFLFENEDAVDRFQNSAHGLKLKNSMRSRGLQGLEFWHNGMKQLSANKPLIFPDDAAGLTFRIQASDVLQAQFETLNAKTKRTPLKDVHGALQTGEVDGHENTWSNIYGRKLYELQDGVTETNHGVLDYMVVTSLEWWESLTRDTRAQFSRILSEVTDARNREAQAVNRRNRQLIIEARTEVRRLTPDRRAMWVAAMRPVWDKFEDEIGADLIKAAQSYNRLQ